MRAPETAALGPLARHDDAPVFDEPWQAQVLALAFNLVERNQFTAASWSQTLGKKLAEAQARGLEDTADTYYKSVLAALEHLLAETGYVSKTAADAREEDWRQAYLKTPHGQPVVLER